MTIKEENTGCTIKYDNKRREYRVSIKYDNKRREYRVYH